MRVIKVDNEVFSALEGRAEGFHDDPNRVLRRLLNLFDSPNGKDRKRIDGKQAINWDEMPSLEEVLAIRNQRKKRSAKRQTINDIKVDGQHERRKSKTSLSELIKRGILSEGETLYFRDYRGRRYKDMEAVISDGMLEYNGERFSMSKLAKKFMIQLGYKSSDYRGPMYWYTNDDMNISDIWEENCK